MSEKGQTKKNSEKLREHTLLEITRDINCKMCTRNIHLVKDVTRSHSADYSKQNIAHKNIMDTKLNIELSTEEFKLDERH